MRLIRLAFPTHMTIRHLLTGTGLSSILLSHHLFLVVNSLTDRHMPVKKIDPPMFAIAYSAFFSSSRTAASR